MIAAWHYPFQPRDGARHLRLSSTSAGFSGKPPVPRGCKIFTSTTSDTMEATMALNRRLTAPIVMALGGWKRSG